jgi:hypothetical protein
MAGPGGVMYREVTMIEVLEVLRLWRAGLPTKRLAAQLGLDPKTARRYLSVAETVGSVSGVCRVCHSFVWSRRRRPFLRVVARWQWWTSRSMSAATIVHRSERALCEEKTTRR